MGDIGPYNSSDCEPKSNGSQRRVSSRLQSIPESKRPFYGSSPKKSIDSSAVEVGRKKAKVNSSRQESVPNLNAKKAEEKGCGSDLVVLCSSKAIDSVDKDKGAIGGSSPTNAPGKSSYAMVKETLRIFNTHYLHFVQEEEKRCNVQTVANGSKSKKEGTAEDDVKRSSKRPDLKAISKMLVTNATLHHEKRFGPIPGIDVGYQFFSRAEMVVVGLHGHWLCGIDYMGNAYSRLLEYKGYTFPLAVSIVISGQYEDDVDDSEDVVYTGQGGNDLLGNKRQIKDQVLTRGNLALKNSMEQSVPVRVIRGHESSNSYCGRVYTYDGLYKVVQYWAEKGVSGFTVFKYRLRRQEGQPTLTTNQVQFARGRASVVPSKLRGLACEDICQGLEDICIPATNIFDDPPIAPSDFKYIKSIQISKGITLPPNAPGCKCKGSCTNPKTCSCAQLNGSDFPYVSRNGGRLIEAQDVVFECGPNCGCGPSCVNRTSQRGLKYRLEVFRTANKGWAVRSWDYIPSGAPVCEYVGVLKRSDDLDSVSENDYIFEIDCWQTINGIGGRERRLRDVSFQLDDKISESAPEFCLDAGPIGNVARFINHSCEPNLFVQCVLSSHHDIRLARVVLFAADNIPPLQELTYDYGYALDSVVGSDGKIKKLECHCGVVGCRKRLY